MVDLKRLTVKGVERIKPPKVGQEQYYDARTPRMALRVSAGGKKSWLIQYRLGGKPRRYYFGRYPSMDMIEAREKAGELLKLVDKGIDPYDVRAEAEAKKKAEAEKEPTTFEAVVDKFMEDYAKKRTRSWKWTEWVFTKYVTPHWAGREIDTITRTEVKRLVKGIARRTPYQANRTLAVIRKLMNWAVEEEIIMDSSADKVKPPGGKETARERVLTHDEIKALWDACGELGQPFGAFMRMLLVTGQRRGEVAAMRWDEIKDDLWVLPGEKTKNGKSHDVPLSPLAVEILDGLPKRGAHVFTTLRRGDRPISGFSRAKKQVDQISSVTGWVIHDLRRTAATGIAALKVPAVVCAKLLNHSDRSVQGITAIYNRHEYAEEKRDALNAWANKVKSIVTQGGDDNVVQLRAS